MQKPSSTASAKGRPASRKSSHGLRESEISSERKQRLALNRFTYSGGYDGYEGRMILPPHVRRSAAHDK